MSDFKAFYVAAIIIAIAAFPLDYGWYTLIRFVGCFAFGIAAYLSFTKGQHLLPYALGLFAILFNPFIKIHFDKEVWAVLDIVAAIFLSAWAYLYEKNYQ